MKSRVHESRWPIGLVFGGASLLGLILCISFAFAGVDFGLNLALVALALGMVLPLGIELRNKTGRRRRVLILDYRVHQFGHAVARGATRSFIEHEREWDVEIKCIGADEDLDAIQWQIRQLQKAQLRDVDGVILVPAGDDEALWFALASVIKTDVFVVVVDTKPPNKVFRDIGIDPPRFVSSRYSETGVLIGEHIAEWLCQGPERQCVLWTGPNGSWPGEERSRNIIYEIARTDALDRTILFPIDSWVPERQRCLDTLRFVGEFEGETAIYCADDENAMALHLFCLTSNPMLRSKMEIVGCNGTPDDWGNIQVLEMHAADATVDIQAEEIGARAALLFIKERHGKLDASERTVFIDPRLLSRPQEMGSWLDDLESGRVAEIVEPVRHLTTQ